MIKVYGIKNCNKIKDTLKWFSDHNVDISFIDLKKSPLKEDQLAGFAQKIGLDVLINKRGTTWRKSGLKNSDADDQELFDTLLNNQTMIKRPLIESGDALLIGYDEDAFEAFLD